MLWTMQGHYPYFFYGEEKDFGAGSPLLNRYLNVIHHYDEVIGAIIKDLKAKHFVEQLKMIF